MDNRVYIYLLFLIFFLKLILFWSSQKDNYKTYIFVPLGTMDVKTRVCLDRQLRVREKE